MYKMDCITSDGGCCPACRSKDIVGKDFDIGDEVTRNVTCNSCNNTWTEVLRVCDVTEVNGEQIDPPVIPALHTIPKLSWLMFTGTEEPKFYGPFDWQSDQEAIREIITKNPDGCPFQVFINLTNGNLCTIEVPRQPQFTEIRRKIRQSQRNRWNKILNGEIRSPSGKEDVIDYVTFNFGNGYEVDINLVKGDPYYINAVLFNGGHEVTSLEPNMEKMEGEYIFNLPNGTDLTVILE